MASFKTTSQPPVLIVSDMNDDSLRVCLEELRNVGASIETVRDVYAAIAKLASGAGVLRVLLDVRTLDEREMAFPRVAARYYPAVEVLVPRLEGTLSRLERSSTGLRTVEVNSIAARIAEEYRPLPNAACERRPEELVAAPSIAPPSPPLPDSPMPVALEIAAPDAPATQFRPSAPPPHNPVAAPSEKPMPLSTDGGPEADQFGPSLHDAVRARMAGDDPRNTARRTPPRSVRLPPATPPVQDELSKLPDEKPSLSAEEFDALLGEEGAESLPPDVPGEERPAEEP